MVLMRQVGDEKKGTVVPDGKEVLSNSGFDQMAGKKSPRAILIPEIPRKKRMFPFDPFEVVSTRIGFLRKTVTGKERKMKKD